MLGNNIQQLLSDFVGIGVKEPDPLWQFCRDLRQPSKQVRQSVLEAEILTVAGCVLADQIDLAHAHCKHLRSLVNHAFEAAATELAPKLRNDAERTRMVAAFRDFDVRGVPRCREYASSEIVIQVRHGRERLRCQSFAKGGDLFELIGSEDGVYFRNVALNFWPVALYQAARHDEPLGLPGLLVLGYFDNGFDRFLLGRIDKTARVDDDDVGFGGIGRQLVTIRHQLTHHDFGIDQVFGTPEAYKSDLQRATNIQGNLQDNRARSALILFPPYARCF